MDPFIPRVKLIVCCDGTACSEYIQTASSSLTNVSRLARAIKQFDDDGVRQFVLYLPGIGTDEGNRFNKLHHITGKGLNNLILEAYTFLSHNWKTAEDDIILVGFSRGAFAMRCLADFIIKYGISSKAELADLHTKFPSWQEGETGDGNPNNARIRVCALWDTVSTMGLRDPIFHGLYPFVDSRLNPRVENAFQALSLHEHRYHYHPLVWERRGDAPSRLEQCWFAGYHRDVGGGDKEGALAHFALVWVIAKLRKFLSFDERNMWQREPRSPAWTVPTGVRLNVQDSSRWYFKAGARMYRLSDTLHKSWGSLYRRPRCQFRTGRRLVDRPPPETDSREEQMHSSLGFLDDNNSFERPLLCTERDGHTWAFSLSKMLHPRLAVGQRTAATGTYGVDEETMEDHEKGILSAWAQHQRRDMFEEGNPVHELGAQATGSLAAELIDWLEP